MGNTIKLVMTIVQLLIQYGPAVYKLAKQIYDMIEGISKDVKEKTGSEMPSAEKKLAFNAALSEKVELTPAGIATLREGIWAIKNKKPLGSKP